MLGHVECGFRSGIRVWIADVTWELGCGVQTCVGFGMWSADVAQVWGCGVWTSCEYRDMECRCRLDIGMWSADVAWVSGYMESGRRVCLGYGVQMLHGCWDVQCRHCVGVGKWSVGIWKWVLGLRNCGIFFSFYLPIYI